MNRPVVLLFALILLVTQAAYAWSTKEHVMITRTAVRNLLASDSTPPDMKAWLLAAQPNLGSIEDEHSFLMTGRMGIYPRGVDGLAFWAVTPDLMADSAAGKERKVEPFNVPEGSLHFLDLEYFMPNEADRTFAADLSHRPAITDIPHDMSDPRWQKAGMLPFRIEGCYSDLVSAIRSGRLVDKPGQFPRDNHATRLAGQLAHYAADNWMPLHATMDYQCYSWFPDAPRKPRVHFDMEFRLTDDDTADYPQLREQFWNAYLGANAIEPAPAEKDVWTSSVRYSSIAYAFIPMIGKAARGAYLDPAGNLKGFDAEAFFAFKDRFPELGIDNEISILDLKAIMMSKGVKWTERLWLDAWRDAHSQQSLRALRSPPNSEVNADVETG